MEYPAIHLATFGAFSGGLNNYKDDNVLDVHESSDCQNVICDKRTGPLRKVRGQQKLNSVTLGGAVQGTHAYYQGLERRLVVAANGKVVYWDPATETFVDIKTGLNTAAPTFFETCVNYLVAFNGADAPWKWDMNEATPLANAPIGKFCILHKEKLFTVTPTNPSRLVWCDSFEPETWPAVNYWDIGPGDGDKLTGFVTYLDDLLVFKRHSMYTLAGTSLDDMSLDQVERNRGCVGPRANLVDTPYVYFVADDGIYVWDSMKATNLTAYKIPDTWANISTEHLHNACCGRWDNLLWFALPENSSYNNLVLFYSPATGAFWPRRGINASCFTIYDNGAVRKFYSGCSIDGFVREQSTGYSDDGVAINSYWKFKTLDLGDQSPSKQRQQKTYLKAHVFDSPGANDVSLTASIDYGDPISLTLDRDGTLVRKYRFPYGTQGYYITPQISHNINDEGCEIRGIALEFIIKED